MATDGALPVTTNRQAALTAAATVFTGGAGYCDANRVLATAATFTAWLDRHDRTADEPAKSGGCPECAPYPCDCPPQCPVGGCDSHLGHAQTTVDAHGVSRHTTRGGTP